MSTIDDGPTKRILLWKMLQETFNCWNLPREHRIKILRTHEESYASWELAKMISWYGSWWIRAVRIVEIGLALNFVFKENSAALSQKWLRNSNTNEPFNGLSPMELMLSEGSADVSVLEAILKYCRGFEL